MLGRPEALAGLGGRAYCWAMRRIHLHQGATLFEYLDAEVLAAWGYHYS